MLVNGLLSTEDNRFVPIRNDKPNDSGNEMVKLCSNRTTVTKLIIGDSQSRGRAMRLIKYENNKLNGLVKPETGVDILLNSARKDIVNLMKRVATVFCGGANVVGTSNTQMVLKYHMLSKTVVTLTSFR